jgi:hypothetical protein
VRARGGSTGGPAARADPLRRLVKPATPRAASRCPTSTARWSGGVARPRDRSQRSSGPPAARRDGPASASSSSTVGARRGAGNAVSLAPHAGVRRSGPAPAHDAHRLRRGVGLPRGQMGNSEGRPPEPGRRLDRPAGPRPHRPPRSRGGTLGADGLRDSLAAPSACT